jgi:methylglutaconyl-CoA hydratase
VSELSITRSGGIATVTLDRPQVRNALAPALIAELAGTFASLATDDVRVVVLTGAGGAFCAGADIEWMRASRDLSEAENVADASAAQAMLEAVDACPKPVVARVNGAAIGGGAGLVACADIAVAVESAVFAFSEARLGLLPAMVSPYVLRAIGPGHTRELFVSARRFSAMEAHRVGLVHQVVPAEQLDDAVALVVHELMACGPAAIAQCKRLVRDATAAAVLPDLAQRIAAARAGAEGQEGLAAFLEKRSPSWAPSAGS